METVTTIALSRLAASERAMDVRASNIANAATPGFRSERMLFSQWLAPGSGGDRAAYVQDRATYREIAPGKISKTGNPLDLALPDENAWFTVQTASGPRLTRAGRFTLSSSGRLVDAAGQALLDAAGQPLQIPPSQSALTVAGDGTLSTADGVLGRIGVVSTGDQQRMVAEGARNLRAETPTAPVASPHVVQGALDDSNVEPISEVTQMTGDLRTYQFIAQLVQAEADRQQNVIDKLAPKQS